MSRMLQAITDNAPDSGSTTSEEQFVNAQTMALPDTIIHEEPYEPYTVDASELSLSEFELPSLQEPETEEWTLTQDYNARLKAHLAQKRNQQCANELARLKEAYLVITEETRDDKNARRTAAAPLSTLSSEEIRRFVATRAVLDKGREVVGRSRTEVSWGSVEELWGCNAGWGGEEEGGFEECEVDVTWEDIMLRESGMLEHWCRKKSGLRKSWTVRDPSEGAAGEAISDLDS